MEIQLEHLIEKIKNDGVKTAESQAEEILGNARSKADAIIRDAKAEADKILTDAKNESIRLENSGKESLKQAGRDLLLNIKKSIEDIFQKTIQDKTAGALSDASLKEAVLAVLSNWKKDEMQDLNLIISENLSSKMLKELQSALAAEMKNGLTIKPSKELHAGFQVSLKDGSAYFDFSDEELTNLISQFLNPRVAALINN